MAGSQPLAFGGANANPYSQTRVLSDSRPSLDGDGGSANWGAMVRRSDRVVGAEISWSSRQAGAAPLMAIVSEERKLW